MADKNDIFVSSTKSSMAKEMEFNKREDTMRMLLSKLEQKTTKVYEGGGKKKIEAQHELGKLSAR